MTSYELWKMDIRKMIKRNKFDLKLPIIVSFMSISMTYNNHKEASTRDSQCWLSRDKKSNQICQMYFVHTKDIRQCQGKTIILPNLHFREIINRPHSSDKKPIENSNSEAENLFLVFLDHFLWTL